MKLTKLVFIVLALFVVSEAQAHKKHSQGSQPDNSADTAPVSQQEKEHPTMYGKQAKQKEDAANGLEVETWTDSATGLTWTVCALGEQYVDMDYHNMQCYVDGNSESILFNFDDAITVMKTFNEKKLNGFGDWRIPTTQEFSSVIKGCSGANAKIEVDGTCRPDLSGIFDRRLIDRTFLSGVHFNSRYWTSTPASGKPGTFWYLVAGAGFDTEKHDGDQKMAVVLVRGTSPLKSSADPDVLLGRVSDDHASMSTTWTDLATGLTWTVCELGAHLVQQNFGVQACASDNDTSHTFESAIQAVKSSNSESLYGFNDWRIPTVDEFNSILSGCDKPTFKRGDDGVCAEAPGDTPFRKETHYDGNYWTSTVSVKNPGYIWFASSDNVYAAESYDDQYHPNRVVLVRGKSSLKASTNPDGLIQAARDSITAGKAAEQAQLAKEAADQQRVAAEYHAKAAEAYKNMKRGDRVIYAGPLNNGNFTAIVLEVEPDTGLVKIQTHDGDVVMVRKTELRAQPN